MEIKLVFAVTPYKSTPILQHERGKSDSWWEEMVKDFGTDLYDIMYTKHYAPIEKLPIGIYEAVFDYTITGPNDFDFTLMEGTVKRLLLEEFKMKETVVICDICDEMKSIGKCDLCGNDVCSFCIAFELKDIFNRIYNVSNISNDRITVCKSCSRSLSREFDNSTKAEFLEILRSFLIRRKKNGKR